MRPKGAKAVLLITSLAFALPSCKKYDDGPWLSLRSKKARIANVWKIESATRDGADVTSDYDQYDLDLKKDGGATLTAHYVFANTSYAISTSGTWELINDKEDIRFDYDDNNSDETYHILRLKEKEFWIRDGGLELHLMPK